MRLLIKKIKTQRQWWRTGTEFTHENHNIYPNYNNTHHKFSLLMLGKTKASHNTAADELLRHSSVIRNRGQLKIRMLINVLGSKSSLKTLERM